MRFLAALCLPVLLAAQSGEKHQEARNATVSGSVLADETGEPLGRAQVILKPLAGGIAPVAVETDERGRFVLIGVKPGTYTAEIRRDGFLPGTRANRGPLRMPPVFAVESGAKLRGLSFRLTRWSVIAGKIRFDTAEPGIHVGVQVYRKAFVRRRRAYTLAAQARTNDLGEYRIAGLAAGDYVVAVAYTRPLPEQVIEQDPVDEEGRPLARWAYATTFFPSALKLTDAVPVHVDAGQEVGGVDVHLRPVPVVAIRGKLIHGGSGEVLPGAGITLRRVGPDGEGSIPVSISARPLPGGGFEIRNVTSGPYLLSAGTEEQGIRYSARLPLLVTDAPIENLEIVLAPSAPWPVRVSVENGDTVEAIEEGVTVVLEPRSDASPTVVARGGVAQVSRDETYSVEVTGLPPDAYLKSVRVGNEDRLASGVSGAAAHPTVPLEIRVGAKGGRVLGRAYTREGNIAGGVNIALVPAEGPAFAAWYRFGAADELGVFQVRGLAPGRYTLFAYDGDPPCELYDRDELPSCRSHGLDLNVSEGGQTVAEVRLSR